MRRRDPFPALVLVIIAVALVLFFVQVATARPTVATPGIAGEDRPVLALAVCGLAVAYVEVTAEGAVVVWIGEHLAARGDALDDDEWSGVELAAHYPTFAYACSVIRAIDRRVRQPPGDPA